MTLTVLSSLANAQETQPPQEIGQVAPEKEHQWLKQFVGRWSTSLKASMGPGQPDMVCDGVIESRMLVDWWVINEMESAPHANDRLRPVEEDVPPALRCNFL
ncbi:MAG: DUF1579 family protein [Planctomycetales bacterium]|nr:DUF1579 family protein [Planctomycetales bacterium]